MFEKELQSAVDAAKQAGGVVRELCKKGAVERWRKKDGSWVTRADILAEKEINRVLVSALGRPVIVSEETAPPKGWVESDEVWFVDPIDGTAELVAGRDEFTINIGLSRGGVPVLGVIYAPLREELFIGVDGVGAWEEKNDERFTLSFGEGKLADETGKLRFVVSRSHDHPKLVSFLETLGAEKIVKLGSTLKACEVVRGNVDAYVSLNYASQWDTCAAEAIVRVAGGVFTDLSGRAIDYRSGELGVKGMLAASPAVHASLLKEVRVLWPEREKYGKRRKWHAEG
ncbi:3'(2'),5'-bisphosphate nucleotidase CysQ [Candidatus Woesearchaeota archaeon]|nr:MAG: 3'(2'),5'-bisphosphate nucleotidase CysQ [Candidatus Woesearchaeota archaeon]